MSIEHDIVRAIRIRAEERIRECRSTEARFCTGLSSKPGMPQPAVEAWAERQTWQEVLAIIGEPLGDGA